MIIPAISWLCGTLLLFYWPGELPPRATLAIMLAFLLLCIGLRRFSLALLPLGFIWAWFHTADQLENRFPDHWVGQDIVVQGRVISLPEKGPYHLRFLLQCEQWQPPDSDPVSCAHRQRLNWYYPDATPHIGERWQLTVRLKPPIGFLNPGGFDYEKWLFQQRISATGYVRSQADQQRLSEAGFSVGSMRSALADRLRDSLGKHAGLGGVLALTLGVRHELDTEDWQRYQITGTSHLVAISGLHVGLIGILGMVTGRWLWSRCFYLTSHMPAQQFGLILAMLLAVCYAALAGFAIPTQRALVMIVALALSGLLRRETHPWHNLAVALIVVLLWDPFSVLDIGFWLSFSAVGFIFVWLSQPQTRNRLWQGTLIAGVLSLALFPLTQLFFQSVSLVSPLANTIAVPWVSLVILPLCLLGTGMVMLFPPLGELLLQLAANNIVWMNQFLDSLSQLPFSRLNMAVPSSLAIIVALVGIIWLLSPRGIPAKPLGLLLLLPSFIPQTNRLPAGQARITVLDVGQGLSTVIETQHHTLVYDTGPRFPSGFNTGDAVLVPFLRQHQIDHVDRLIISHGDNDHIGGARALGQALPVFRVLSSATRKIDWRYSQRCAAGQNWQWDGVQFAVLHPVSASGWQGNNGSCVLKVTAGDQSLLIPGDIEAGAEFVLLRQQAETLAASVLIAPHHGSRSSSTEAFITQVDPDWVVFPAARFNRYRFPAAEVRDRYARHRVQALTTGSAGAIQFTLGGDALNPSQYRVSSPQIWRYPAVD